MYIYNKIVEQPSPPNSHDVLWINSNDSQLYVFLNNKWQSLSFTSNEYKQDKYDIKLKTNRKNITDSINELFDIIKDIENHYGDINIEDIAKQQTLLECTATILQYIEQQRLQLESTAKEETLTQGISSVENKVKEESQAIQGKIDNIDLSAVESKVQEESTAIQNKIDNIKLPEIDTTELAKQGENAEATNSKILEEIGNVAAALTTINDTLGTL